MQGSLSAESLVQRPLPFERPILDISDWQNTGIEQMGTKPKFWVQDPGGGRWLFKEVTANVRSTGVPYVRGDDWSEVIGSEIGRALGISTATTEFASRGGRSGVISRLITVSAGLVHGNEILSGRDPNYASDIRMNPRYTVEASMAVVSSVHGPPGMHLDGGSSFAGFLVLDALIGNTDRHHENWAILRRFGSNLRLAPSFDHASSLGFMLSDEERKERLATRDHNRTIEAYVSRARTPFAGGPHPKEAARRALTLLGPRERRRWLDAVADVETAFEDVIRASPPSRMSDVARSFALEALRLNRAALLQTLGEVM